MMRDEEKMTTRLKSILLILLLFAGCNKSAPFHQVKTELITVPALIGGKVFHLEAMLYTPLDSAQRHPLIVMTHGRNGPAPKIDSLQVYHYAALNQALAARGYLVMMLVRRGYGNSDGPDSEYLETAEESGLAGAQDIKSSVEYMSTRADVLADRVVVMGQSQGGWISLAASTLEIKGMLGAINISGAINFRRRAGYSIRSAFSEDQLDTSATVFGRSSKVPTLWIYAENDNHSPGTIHWWFNSFVKAGGKGHLVIKPAYKNNGHFIVSEPDLYIDDILDFLKEIGFAG